MAKRSYLLVGNWKMFKTSEQAVTDASAILAGLPQGERVDVGVAPHFVALERVAWAVRGKGLMLYAQDGYAEDEGAFTGAVSLAFLRACVDGTLLGHSERRQFFGETDADVQAKAAAAGRLGLPILVCVGETHAERASGKAEEVVRRQLTAALDGLLRSSVVAPARAVELLDVAYEPVWAISRGDAQMPSASLEDIATMHRVVRAVLEEQLGADVAGVRVLYGGSVKPENAADILALPEVQGALVGGASLDPASFLEIVRAVPA